MKKIIAISITFCSLFFIVMNSENAKAESLDFISGNQEVEILANEHIGTAKKKSYIKENYVNGKWVQEFETVLEWTEVRYTNGFERTYTTYNERVYYDARTNQPSHRTYNRNFYYRVY